MKIEKITHHYNHENILEGIKLVINRGDKIALTGENGSGKSTLLKIIASKLSPESGSIHKDEWETLEYVEQEPFISIEPTTNISDYLNEKDSNMPAVRKMALSLGFSDFEKLLSSDIPIVNLSGGQKKMLTLVIALSENPDTLVLDEPENHLDIVSRKNLAQILIEYKEKLIFVSHDQFIIDAVSNKIALLEKQELSMFGGKDYEEVREEVQQKKVGALQDWKTEKRDIERLKKALVIMQLKARFSTKGQGVYQSRKRDIEKRLEALGEKPKINSFQMYFSGQQIEKKGGKQIVNVSDLSFHFSDSQVDILKDVNLNLRFGERIGLMGRNGTGKTTLLRLLMFELSPTKGNIVLGNDINTGYFGQMDDKYDKESPYKIFEDATGSIQKAHAVCANLGLTEGERKVAYNKMSGGQKTRIRLALLALKNPDFVILDEPTNHLDSQSSEFIMEFLGEYKGTLLVVSHDKNFLNSIGLNKYWVVKDSSVTEEINDLEDVIKLME